MEIEMECKTLPNGRLSLSPKDTTNRPRGKYFAAMGDDIEKMRARAEKYFGMPVKVTVNSPNV
jgi:hypothetical protein